MSLNCKSLQLNDKLANSFVVNNSTIQEFNYFINSLIHMNLINRGISVGGEEGGNKNQCFDMDSSDF